MVEKYMFVQNGQYLKFLKYSCRMTVTGSLLSHFGFFHEGCLPNSIPSLISFCLYIKIDGVEVDFVVILCFKISLTLSDGLSDFSRVGPIRMSHVFK